MQKTTLFRTLCIFAVCLFVTSCMFWESITNPEEYQKKLEEANKTPITSLSFNKQTMNLKVGSYDYIKITVNPLTAQRNVKLKWEYDKSIIECDTTSNWGVTIKALQEGKTFLRAMYDGFEATCVITITGFTEEYQQKMVEPYIYSSITTLQMKPNVKEQVYVSLYNGNASDVNDFKWELDNPTVASSIISIEPTSQYCVINAKDTGYARIKVTHPKALHPYYFGVYVYGDLTKVPFITTQNNILTLKEDDVAKTINVSLVNPKQNSTNQFRYEIIPEDGSSDVPITVQHNNTSVAVINPIKQGFCTLRVTHNDAQYPLDILCRVVKIVQNAYIKPDKQIVTLKQDATEIVTSTIENYNSAYDEGLFSYVLENYDVAEIVNTVGNKVYLKGKANGSTKLIVHYESDDVAYDKEVLIIASEQISDAVDSSMYITTSQNFVRTKLGEDSTEINISLRGGEIGDEKDFTWSVKSESDTGLDVIRLETTNGTAIHAPRQASFNYIGGKAIITPNAIGTAVITITHPKIIYPTEILVKVLPISAVLEEPLYFTGESTVKVLNGETTTYTAELRGKTKTVSDEESISFEIENGNFLVASAGKTATITAPVQGSGATQTFLTVSHQKAENPKKVLVISADTQEELDNYQAMYSDKLYYNIEIGRTEVLSVNQIGFEGTYDDDGHYTPFDFTAIQWTTNKPDLIDLERTEYSPLSYRVTGKKAGVATVVARFNNHTVTFTVTIVPKGGLDVISPEVYFTTSQNVVNISKPSKTANVSVSAVNLSSFEYNNIEWESSNTDIVTVIGNGETATLTAEAEGEAIISVKHEQSQNVLKIYVKVGNEYVYIKNESKVVYINAPDTISMLKDDPMQKITAKLENYTGNNASFTFSIDNTEIATIVNQSADGIAFIKPKEAGIAEVTITSPHSELTKKVLVMVGNTKEELASFVYLTTSTNVVAIAEGQRKTVTASVRNSKDVVINGYTWESSAPHIIDVNYTDGTAVLIGNSVGSAVITVTNKNCTYPLTIIAYCVDPNTASSTPYIQLNNSVLTLNVLSTGYQTIGAELVGGTEEDKQNFIWECSNSNIVSVYGQNGVGKVKALSEGTAYITVKHPKAMYPAQLLVIADKTKESSCYISVPQTNIMLKPTDSNGQLITAKLVNGETTDIYTFQWQVDNPSIIDLIGSANSYRIIPKQAGNCNIIISHPKANGYDQQIAVTVSEYEKFAFPQTNLTMTQGDVKFLTMQVPHTNVTTHIEYSVLSKTGQGWINPEIDEDIVCTIQGTKSVAQISANQKGTTTVKAKLVASSTGIVQAESEMLVYVKEKAISEVNIASSKTIHTIQKGKSATLSATMSGEGITTNDNNNLLWVSNDSDIVQVTGLSADGTIKGKQIYITALKAGEAIITCSHPKATTPLQFYVVVPGTEEKRITLNKTYMDLLKGGSGMQIKATIENSENSDDYANIEWTGGTDVYGTEIVRIMGKGQTPTIYPTNVGETSIFATIYDSDGNKVSRAECVIKVSATKSFVFENTRIKVEPFETRRVKYTVSPPNATINWQQIQTEDFYTFEAYEPDENGVGYVEITGAKVGQGTLNGITDANARGQLNITISWDYGFEISAKENAQSSRTFNITPQQTVSYTYKVHPATAVLSTSSYDTEFYTITQVAGENGTGTITIKPKKESANQMNIAFEAVNPKDDNHRIGTIQLTGYFKYGENSITPKLGIINSDGKWSRFDTNTNILYIGDGENVKFKVEATEPNANVQISKVEFTPLNDKTPYVSKVTQNQNESGSNYGVYSINGGEDVVEYGYEIQSINVLCLDGIPIDWRNDVEWEIYINNYSGTLAGEHKCRLIHTMIYKNSSKSPLFKCDIDHQSAWSWGILSGSGCDTKDEIYIDEIPAKDIGDDFTNYDGVDLSRCSLNTIITTPNYKIKIANASSNIGTWFTITDIESRWSRVLDTSMKGTFLSEEDIKKYPYLFEPSVSSKDRSTGGKVLNKNITYMYRETTDNKLSSTKAGQLEITIIHNGKLEKSYIPVYYEKRISNKNK